MRKPKILVMGWPGSLYDTLFSEIGAEVIHDSREWRDSNLIVFTGGPDVDPTLYGQEPAPQTSKPDVSRDVFELELMQTASLLRPMIGICRGAQLGCVMSGGSLVQHVEGHGCSHPITTIDGVSFQVSSTHHQAMKLTRDVKYHVLAWAECTGEFVPEVVYFPHTEFMSVQYHPEQMNRDSKGWAFFQKLLREHLVI